MTVRPTGVGPAQTWTINNHDAPVGLPLARKVGGLVGGGKLEGADVLILFVTP